MAEELQESEVFYSEGTTGNENETEYSDNSRRESQSNNNNKLKRKNKNTAAPVNIPGSISISSWVQYVEPDFFDDVEIVPPHVIVGRRRVAAKMAFSVCSGNGRTLKGRDLSQVRNSILKMTGFLES